MARFAAVGAVALVLGFGGCAGLPAPQPGANYGPPPAAAVIQPETEKWFRRILIDPESARYEYGSPYRAYVNRGLLLGGGIAWAGWAVDVNVNARNRLGGYTGRQTYHVAFKGDSVVEAYPAQVVDSMFHRAP